MVMDRRSFLRKIAAAGFAAVTTATTRRDRVRARQRTLPAVAKPTRKASANPAKQIPTTTPIKHLVAIMQENHTFDNYFGTYPGADGIPHNTRMPVDPFNPANTDYIEPFHMGDNDVENDDPDHSARTHRRQYNEGRMDGFVHALNLRNQDGRLAMAYYDDRDLPYYWNAADQYVLFDRFFSSAAGGSYLNHVYWVAATGGGMEDRLSGTSLDHLVTIFDRLEERGISWKFYIQNYEPELTYRTVEFFPGNRASQVVWCPLLAFDRFIDDPQLSSHIVHLKEYFKDLENGTLPAVAYIAPSGPSEHPPSNLQSGQRFVRSLIQELMRSDAWESSAFLLVYDDWGGWFDHVPPPQIDEDGYGFRVPALLISPYAKQGHVDHTVLDFASIIKFVEENWGVEPLATRDAQADTFLGAFDFEQPARPPEFIPWERTTGPHSSEPRRAVIYVAYGTALAAAGGLVAWATRRHKSDSHR
jgi:phospholipase C